MSAPLGFSVDDQCLVRQLDLKKDRMAIAALGVRCADYLRTAAGCRTGAKCVPRLLLEEMLVPTRVPLARGYIFGIFRHSDRQFTRSTSLAGVLYFLHPETNPDSWYIPLMLLEPAARGQGVGSAVHGAFTSWAAARGARRLTVAVAEDNPRARRFWCERMGYLEVPACARQQAGNPDPWKPEYVRRVGVAERVRLRAA